LAISVTSQPGSTENAAETHQGLTCVILNPVSVGAFISKDPIGFNGGNNLYRYADNNPMKWLDPWGLYSFGGVERIYDYSKVKAAVSGSYRKASVRAFTAPFISVKKLDLNADCCTLNDIELEMKIVIYFPNIGAKIPTGMSTETVDQEILDNLYRHEWGHVMMYKIIADNLFSNFENSVKGKSFTADSPGNCRDIINNKIEAAKSSFIKDIKAADDQYHLYYDFSRSFDEMDWSWFNDRFGSN
jgi:hypothetical protein